MAETLRQRQSRFAREVALLIQKATELGYEVTLGDAYRDPRAHGQFGEKKGYAATFSVHKVRLAVDLNLFRDGRFLTSSEAHRPLGEWWESRGADHRWGGRWNDGNHYSFSYRFGGNEYA